MFLLLALLIGVVAGLRSATAPAAVGWGGTVYLLWQRRHQAGRGTITAAG